jgi:hypothetical protein
VLTGDSGLDEPRTALVRRILEQAVGLCESCCCGAVINSAQMPIERLEFLALAPAAQDGLRPATSCYRCLRSHRNQREHALLDRYDAATLIREILQYPSQTHGAFDRNSLSLETPDAFQFQRDDGIVLPVLLADHTPNQGDWVVLGYPEGGGAYGEWFLASRTQKDGSPINWLRLRNGVGLDQGITVTDGELAALKIWKPTS